MRLVPGSLLNVGPQDWRDSDGDPLRILVSRAVLADSYYDQGPWIRVEGWDLDADMAPTSVYIRLREGENL